ncbi:MAG: hypothetical protein M1839_003009 [Geoglossum umbratile]|nr:MAG: hypothetical protein M1839_003009 [Geoglossum umbratile]
MGTDPERRQSNSKVGRCSPSIGTPELMPIPAAPGKHQAMSPKRFRQEVEAGPATSPIAESHRFIPMIKRIRRLESDCSTQKSRHGFVPMIKRIRRLESDRSAQKSCVAELEELVFELRKEVFGVVHGSAGFNEGERVLRVDTSNTASMGSSTSVPASGRADGIGGRSIPIKVEDDEDSILLELISRQSGSIAILAIVMRLWLSHRHLARHCHARSIYTVLLLDSLRIKLPSYHNSFSL